jgi:hypothetical protein
MRDREIVSLLTSPDGSEVRRGLAVVCDEYAGRLQAYAGVLLHGLPDTVVDESTGNALLVAAARARNLQQPERLRPWLYAVTRNECLRVLRAHRREHLGSARDAEVRVLSTEHGLDAPELALVLRISEHAAHELVHRLHEPASRAAPVDVPDRPDRVRQRLLDSRLDPVAAGTALAAKAGPFDREGFPAEIATRRTPVSVALAGVAVLLVALLSLGWWAREHSPRPDPNQLPTTQVNTVLIQPASTEQ